MMRPPPTLFVVDDHEVVRESLVLSLSVHGHQVVSFESAEAFLDQYQPVELGCLILDVRLGGMSGLELQDTLAAQGIDLPIIFMSGHADVPMSVRAIKHGAVDFLEKPFTTDQLLRRIKAALSEQERILDKLNSIVGRFKSLTPREKDVLVHLAENPGNHTSKTLARILSVSPRTIEHHRAQMMTKMRAQSITELMMMAQQLDLGKYQ